MKKPKNYSTSFYFYLILLIAIGPLFCYALIDNFINRSRNIRVANNTLVEMANSVEQDLMLQYNHNEQLLATLSIQAEIDPQNPEKCVAMLERVQENLQPATFLGVANLDGKILCGTSAWDGSIQINDRDYFIKAVENEQFWAGFDRDSQISSSPSVGYSYPFSMPNDSQVYIFVAIQKILDINNLMIIYPSYEDISIEIYDPSGKFMFDSNAIISEDSNISPKSLNLKAVGSKDNDFNTIMDKGVKYLIFNKAIKNNGNILGYIFLRTPTSIIYREVQNRLYIELLIICLLAIGSIFIAHRIMNKQIIKPLEDAKAFSEGLQIGNLKNRLKIQSKSIELQVLGRTLNEMVNFLVSGLDQKEKGIKRISALNIIDKNITSHLSINETYQVVINITKNILYVDACVMLEYDEKSENFQCVANTGFFQIEENDYYSTVIEAMATPILTSKEPVLIRNFHLDADQSYWKVLEKEGFEYFYAIPINLKEKIVGVIGIFQRGDHPLNDDTIDIVQTLARQTAMAIGNARLIKEIMDKNIALKSAYDKTIEGWSKALELRDDETAGHTNRVADITVGIAKKMGFDQELVENIRRGALLHDVGKIGIPDSILLKAGLLDDEERKIIEKHPVFAYNQLQPIEFLRDAIQIPYCHHEKWDGTGYPRGLKGEAIPVEARIFAIVDVWDALLSDRPYRKAWPEDQAIDYMREQSGKYFDPEILKIFFDFMQKKLG